MTPSTKRWLWLKWLTLAGTAAFCVWLVVEVRAGSARKSAADRQAQIEAVGYYRVRASYTVKDTGERIDFDYVAACATVVTMYRDGDRSVDTPFGIAPKTFILPTQGGHAIQVVTPKACNREAEEGYIPPDLIPLTIFYEDVRDLHFGWGYTSQDAYDNARARMGFEGATITAATYADFMAWRAKAAAEFKPVGQIKSPWGYSYEAGTGLNIAGGCTFYTRDPVREAGKPGLTAEWEKRGKPEFWLVNDFGQVPKAWGDLSHLDAHYGSYVVPRTKGGGVGTIQNYSSQVWGKVHYKRDVLFPPNEVYPYLPISLASTPPPTLASTVFPTKVPVSDDWKGLATCGVNDPKIDDVFRAGKFNGVLAPAGDKYIGEPIGDRTGPFMANDTVMSLVPGWWLNLPRHFFQRDEFVLTQGPSNLEGIMP